MTLQVDQAADVEATTREAEAEVLLAAGAFGTALRENPMFVRLREAAPRSALTTRRRRRSRRSTAASPSFARDDVRDARRQAGRGYSSGFRTRCWPLPPTVAAYVVAARNAFEEICRENLRAAGRRDRHRLAPPTAAQAAAAADGELQCLTKSFTRQLSNSPGHSATLRRWSRIAPLPRRSTPTGAHQALLDNLREQQSTLARSRRGGLWPPAPDRRVPTEPGRGPGQRDGHDQLAGPVNEVGVSCLSSLGTSQGRSAWTTRSWLPRRAAEKWTTPMSCSFTPQPTRRGSRSSVSWVGRGPCALATHRVLADCSQPAGLASPQGVREAGWVRAERRGTNVSYTIRADAVERLCQSWLTHFPMTC